MHRLTLWIASTLSGLAMLITYQASLNSAADAANHVPAGCLAAIPSTVSGE